MNRETPDQIYGELFEAVQSQRTFSDSKTFVDAVAKSAPSSVLDAFRSERDNNDFDLRAFVEAHFTLPDTTSEVASDSMDLPVVERIEQLWDILTRAADKEAEHSSLIALPNPYIVPGGRFREVYYWDGYFTMLGLAESGRFDLIRNMVENFAYLIDEVGFVPNGNRSYYCSRSQPPYFALMVELLAHVTDNPDVLMHFRPQIKREYDFWMSGMDLVSQDNPAYGRVVAVQDGFLNRYWDDSPIPRQESYAQDMALANNLSRDAGQLFRDLRAGAESGWDFSSRWFEDGQSIKTIRTTQILPIDLNTLMFKLESTLAAISEPAEAELYRQRAKKRRQLLRNLFFDEQSGMFVDLTLDDLQPTGILSVAATYPLFFGVATPTQAKRVATCLHDDFLKPGGWLTTLTDSDEQWDKPNGWAPMQWTAYQGLKAYGFEKEARAGANAWVKNNLAIYGKNGRLLEKYNVCSVGLAGSGGEYAVQDGFGWTNGVLLCLLRELDLVA